MKYMSLLFYFFSSILMAAPLVKLANYELEKSKHFVYVENDIMEVYLIEYTKLIKGRYFLTKKIPWYTKNIAEAIELNAQNAKIKGVYEK